MSSHRLSRVSDVSGAVALPGYVPGEHGVGIVHLGMGAFHRAHQAVYTDTALAVAGGDWRTTGVSLRRPDVAEQLNPQNGLYSLLERGTDHTSVRIIGSVANVLVGAPDRNAIQSALTAPQTRIVSLTVTEKAYGIDRLSGTVDPSHPAVAADLAAPQHPTGVLGILVAALQIRRDQGFEPFTVLCCDNLPDNGALIRAGVVDFARQQNPDLARWIEDQVTFPSTMVDRITPAATERTRTDARNLIGCEDPAAIETEAFSQWAIEDNFCAGRPAWEAAGALLVSDVRPYELMKLRMLNGAHSMLAYSGFLTGCTYVRDVMRHGDLAKLVDRHLLAAQTSLPDQLNFDLGRYRAELIARFANTSIAHRTEQIAMDGSEKIPQRLLMPAGDAVLAQGDFAPFAFAVAAWMRYCLGRHETGAAYALNDPREAEIRNALQGSTNANDISAALHGLPRLFPATLQQNAAWRNCVAAILNRMLVSGMSAVLAQEARSMSPAQHQRI